MSAGAQGNYYLPDFRASFPAAPGNLAMRPIARVALAILACASWNAAASAEEDALAQAVAHYKRAQWQDACSDFEKFLAENPGHARAQQARFYYGEALAQLNRLDEARAQFGQLLEQDPMGRFARQALYRRGEAAYLAGDRDGSKQDLEAFLEKYASDLLCARALPYLASIALEQGDGQAAERLFSSALAQYPTGPLAAECRLGLARAEQLLGKRDLARRAYRELSGGEGAIAAAALLELGTLENSLGEHESALDSLNKLEHEFPKYQPARRQLGIGYALVKLDRHADAETPLAAAALDNQLAVEAGYWLGMAQKSRGKLAAAIESFNRAAAADEKHRLAPACVYQAADGLIELNDFDRANATLKSALARWPDDAWSDDFQFGMLRIAVTRNDQSSCIALAEELLDRWPKSALRQQAMLAKARALVALKKHAEAAKVLTNLRENVDQLDADERVEAEALLAQAQADQGQLAEAERSLQSVRGGNSGETLVVASLKVAEAAYQAGDFERAARLFRELTKNEPVQAAAWSGLAWSHYRQKAWQPAAEAFRQVVDKYPSDQRAPEAALMAGLAFEQLEQPDAALVMYALVAEKYGQSDRAEESLWRLGLLQEKTGAVSQASETYAQLAARFPKFEQMDAVLYRRARLLEIGHQEKQAADVFERLRQEFPKSQFAQQATLWLAERALADDQVERAAQLQGALDLSTASSSVSQRALLLEGQLAMAQQRWEGVDPPLAKLLAEVPAGDRADTARYLIAEVAFRRNDFESAAERFAALSGQPETANSPRAAMIELRRAQALAQLKRWNEAGQIAAGIETRFVDFERQHEADYLVGRCRAAAADFDGAREAYRKAIASPRATGSETQAIAQWMLAETYFHQEDYRTALTEYDHLDETCKFPRWHAAALLQSGKCREHLGQWSAAVETYEQLLKKHPDSEFSAEANERREIARNRYAAESATRK